MTGRTHHIPEADVVVVGGGPVGLTLACALDDAGIPVCVLEAEAELSRVSHASTFHASTLEILDGIGVAHDLIARGVVVNRLQYRDLPSGRAVELNFDSLSGDTRFPFRLQVEQGKLKPLLLERLQASDRARVIFGARATEVDERGAPVVRGTVRGRPFHLQARFVVGADGAHSAIRHALGISFPGDSYARPLLRIITAVDVLGVLPDLAPVTYMADTRGSCSLLTLPDHYRLGFRLSADQGNTISDADVQEHLRRVLPGRDCGYPTSSADVIAVHRRVAETFGRGHVLLAGDAAHINNPSGGFGMNSGIHDAWLLAHLLASAIRREAALEDVWSRLERRRETIVENVIGGSERHLTRLDAGGSAWIEEMTAIANDVERTRDYLYRAAMFDSTPVLD